MQSFTEIPDTLSLTASRPLLLSNDKTALSNSSGTAFPTTNLQVGMFCFRTDQSKLYQLTALTPTWVELMSITGGVATFTGGATGNAATATKVSATVAGTAAAELVRGNMADNDSFRILVGGTATDAGWAEIATADGGNEPIYVRQYTGAFATVTRTLTLLDASGNTTLPGTLTATDVTITSDERLKSNWWPVGFDFLGRLAEVKSGSYEKQGLNKRQVGVSAQSLRQVIPEAVNEDSDGMLSVSYGNAALVAAIELAKEVRLLREELALLKERLK